MDLRARSLAGSLLIILAGLVSAAGYQLPGRVLQVIDGDSLVLEVRGSLYQVELADIDAPELNQPWGAAAADHLNATLAGMFVVVSGEVANQTVHGRVVFKGRDVALDMLRDGLAWSTVAIDPRAAFPHPYSAAQRQAHEARRGLWSDKEPIPPWAWRAGVGAHGP